MKIRYTGSTTGSAVHAEELCLNDRIENMFIGAGMGLAVVGTAGSVAAGSASAYIAAFGGTGAQTFSIGAIAYDLFTIIAAPILGVEMEMIEIEP